MTPKEKAEELIQQFKRYSWISCVEGYEESSNLESAKYCAIIAQQRIIDLDCWNFLNEEELEHQVEILKEIEKL